MTVTRYERDTRLEREDALLARALSEAGSGVGGVWDLVHAAQPYPEAIPVLIEMLPRISNPRLREGIARALGVREARPIAAKPLREEFLRSVPETHAQQQAKWAIGYALGSVSDDSVFDDAAALLRDRAHGWTRGGLVHGLAHMRERRADAVALLFELLGDPECAVDAAITLGSLNEPSARAQLEGFLDHPDAWVRHKMKQALARLDGARSAP